MGTVRLVSRCLKLGQVNHLVAIYNRHNEHRLIHTMLCGQRRLLWNEFGPPKARDFDLDLMDGKPVFHDIDMKPPSLRYIVQ